jgi:hypothetical protein
MFDHIKVMKKTFLIFSILAALSLGVFAQESREKASPTEKDKIEAIPADSYLKRGATIGAAKKVSLAKVFNDPSKYAGQPMLVEGVIVRSCKMEGCWAELAAEKDGKRSVRVKMKDHAFFIPLNSAGSFARAEGTFSVKTLSKAEVDHLVNEDGAKFESRNPDGSVTELSFVATGIALKRALR